MSNRPSARPSIRDPRRDEKRRAWVIRGAATVVVVVVAVGIAVWLISTRDDKSSSAAGPSVATSDGYYRVSTGGTGSPRATVEITEDFQCPSCRAFEAQFGSTVEAIRGMQNVSVEYRPVAILDRSSSTNYSTRSASASACVAEATAGSGDWATWLKFHDALYAQQPPEGGSGLTDQKLTEIAQSVGAGDVGKCISDERYGPWVGSVTQKATKEGLQGTPQIEINGKVVQLSTPQALMDAVTAASRG
ncbi:DsbA family protein [Williamsia sp. SKLECPSW1]